MRLHSVVAIVVTLSEMLVVIAVGMMVAYLHLQWSTWICREKVMPMSRCQGIQLESCCRPSQNPNLDL